MPSFADRFPSSKQFSSALQGPSLGPAPFVVIAANPCPVTTSSFVVIYADGAYLIVPVYNVQSCATEISNVKGGCLSG
jgi:hypothetical protein